MSVDWWSFFWLAARAALFSSNGVTNLPTLREDLLARGWATDRDFAEAFAVGQVAPGPNGLWVVSLGYLMGGWFGAAVALVASLPPPALVLVVERVYRRYGHHPAMTGFIGGLSLAVVGAQSVVLCRLLIANGLDAVSLLIAVGAIALALTRRLPIIAILGLAGLIGVLVPR